MHLQCTRRRSRKQRPIPENQRIAPAELEALTARIGDPVGDPRRPGLAFTPSHVALLTAVRGLYDPLMGGCWATNAFLAARLKLGVRRTAQLIADCTRMGLIEKHERMIKCSDRPLPINRRVLVVPVRNGHCEKSDLMQPEAISGGAVAPKGSSPSSNVSDSFLTPALGPPRSARRTPGSRALSRHATRTRRGAGESKSPRGMVGWSDGDDLLASVPRQVAEAPPPPDERCFAWVDRLRDAVVTKTAFYNRYSSPAWAKQFALLLEYLKGDSTRLQRVLDWFIEHINDRYTPRVRSAKAFRERFPDVEAAMARDLEQAPPAAAADPRAEPDPDADWHVENLLARYEWPNGSADRLRDAYVRSVRALQEMLRRIDGAPLDRGSRATFDLIVFELSPYQFVETYFVRVLDTVSRWDDWNGDLSRFVIAPDVRLFRSTVRELAKRASGDPFEWDALLKAAGY